MKQCKCCGGTSFEIIGGFFKICLNCFSAEKTTKEEQEELDANSRQTINAESVFSQTETKCPEDDCCALCRESGK